MREEQQRRFHVHPVFRYPNSHGTGHTMVIRYRLGVNTSYLYFGLFHFILPFSPFYLSFKVTTEIKAIRSVAISIT
jgi:hypothetical protein